MYLRRARTKVVACVALCSVGLNLLVAHSSHGGGEPAYIPDRYKGVILYAPQPQMPSYSSNERMIAIAVYRLVINRTTGTVDEIKVIRGIGRRRIDAAAIWALFQWKFRPGVLKSIDVPVHFERELLAELREAHSAALTTRQR